MSYTVCVCGVYRCCSRSVQGVADVTPVNGYNLSNFIIGGVRGCATGDWSQAVIHIPYLLCNLAAVESLE